MKKSDCKKQYVEQHKAETLRMYLEHTAFSMRRDMTPITRYLKLSRDKHPDLSDAVYCCRKRSYEMDAIRAMERILDFLNNNKDLVDACKMNVDPDLILEQPTERDECCEKCIHLKVLNWNKVYGLCKKTGIVFKPFELDTRTFSCPNYFPSSTESSPTKWSCPCNINGDPIK